MNKSTTIHDVNLPWEKLKRVGVEGLQDEELLSIIIKSGYNHLDALEFSQKILRSHPISKLMNMGRDQLIRLKGITETKANLIISAFELSRRALNQGMGIAPSITCPADAAGMVADIKDCHKEHFIALFLNARNQVIHREQVSVGSLNASLVHPREVFAPAIGSSAASVILAHNHPSGDVTPSREDIELTRRMMQAGDIMGIEVLDHVIVGKEKFISMKEANII